MKKTWSKILALALALLMCVSLLPLSAAADPDYTPQNIKVTLVSIGQDGDYGPSVELLVE